MPAGTADCPALCSALRGPACRPRSALSSWGRAQNPPASPQTPLAGRGSGPVRSRVHGAHRGSYHVCWARLRRSASARLRCVLAPLIAVLPRTCEARHLAAQHQPHAHVQGLHAGRGKLGGAIRRALPGSNVRAHIWHCSHACVKPQRLASRVAVWLTSVEQPLAQSPRACLPHPAHAVEGAGGKLC